MKKHILIVDDDSSIRSGLKKLLKRANYEVCLAANGIEAVKRFFAERIDLLVMDLNMPNQDGWATFENITRKNPYVPTIIMTGLPDQFPIASAAGVGALLEKPLDPEELLSVIRNLLGEPRFNHWLRRRSWLQDARAVPATRFLSGERNRRHATFGSRVSCNSRSLADALVTTA
jgi:DNA-binding NtrC family response regulator